jgi:hypothetical protein
MASAAALLGPLVALMRARLLLSPFLKGHAGYLQADALAQYECLFAGGEVIHVACNAHARRRFVKAQSSAPDEAEEALKYIRKLYKVERELGDSQRLLHPCLSNLGAVGQSNRSNSGVRSATGFGRQNS